MATLPARIIHVGIDRPWQEVYAFASNPENLQHWASGLATGLIRDGEDWIGDGGPIGKVRVRFAPHNSFGIIDHMVKMENGLVVENPIRIVANGDGAEITFFLLKRPDMDDAGFESDAAHVLKDLTTLKAILESTRQEQALGTSGADRKIDYIEFNVTDIERAKSFYRSAFGWTFTDYGPDYCEFQDGRLTGGFARAPHVNAKGGALIILFADELEDIQAEVEKAGGTIVKPIFSFPGGRRFHFTDPEGYELAVWSDR